MLGCDKSSREQLINDLVESQIEIKRLRKELGFYVKAIEQSSQPFASGYPNGHMMYSNNAFCELTGYSKEELKSMTWAEDLTPPEWRKSEASVLDKLRQTGKPQRYEKEYIRKDGIRVPIEILVHQSLDLEGNVEYFYSFITGIIERKKAEKERDWLLKELKNYSNKFSELVKEKTVELKIVKDELERAFELSYDIICISDFNHRFLRVNPSFERILGYTTEEATKLRTIDLIHPDDLKTSISAGGKSISNNIPLKKYRIRCRCKDETYRRLEWTSVPVLEEQLFYSVVRDVTEEIHAKEKLQASEHLFRTSIENMLDCFGIHTSIRDDNGKIIDFRYDYVNESACRTIGLKREQLIGRGLIELFPAHLENGLFERYREVVESDKPLIIDSMNYYKDGLNLTFENRIAKLGDGFIASWRDITERKLAEQTLRLSEERFSKAFNANPSPMSITSLNEGRYIDVNDGFLNLIGYTREEVIGQLATELNIFVKDEERLELRRQLAEEGICKNLEVALHMKSGELRYGLAGATIVDINDKPCILGVFNDITRRKELEIEVLRLDRLNLVGEMAAGIGHEIRNPMTTVRGFLQLLASKEECSKYKGYFNLMIEELDRANSIITEFLSLAKNKKIQLGMQNLKVIIENIFPLIQADGLVTDKYICLELDVVPDLLSDEKEIRQLILNLARNGLESMSAGKKLTLKTYQEGSEVVLAVKDEGEGIPKHLLEKIGTPFFTTKDKGTGLGLAVCYRIAERHNAKIEIETGPIGTTFFVRFKC